MGREGLELGIDEGVVIRLDEPEEATDDRAHRRPVVEERDRLLPRRRDLRRLERRRLRGPARSDRADRLPGRDRRHLPLADALLPVGEPRRRLRRRRLPRRRPQARDARRPGRAGADGARARHPRDRRPGGEPHLRPAPLVPGGARRPRLALPRLLRLGRRAAARRREDRAGLPRRGGAASGPTTRRRASTTCTTSTATSPTSTSPTRRCATPSPRSSATGWPRACRASASTRSRS